MRQSALFEKEHPDNLDAALRRHVREVLLRAQTITTAARRLGIYRSTLQRMLRRWGDAPRPKMSPVEIPAVPRPRRRRSDGA